MDSKQKLLTEELNRQDCVKVGQVRFFVDYDVSSGRPDRIRVETTEEFLTVEHLRIFLSWADKTTSFGGKKG